MLFAASARQQSTRVTRGLLALLATGLLSVFSVPVPVFATSTTIRVGVRDGLPASLTISTNIEGKIVTQPTVPVEGVVHNVTQIVVYVDGVYNTSLPLSSGSGTYMVAFGVTPGAHEVRISGLDASTNTEASQTVHFTYDPAATSETSGTTTSGSTPTPVDNYINQTIDAAKATKEDVAQKVNQASSSGPISDLSDVMFNAFKSVDLISATDGAGVNKMAGRFTLVSAGLAASVFPWTAYAAVSKLRFLPHLAVPNGIAMTSMRVAGIALMLIPFIFIH